jgi:hypothetical protein
MFGFATVQRVSRLQANERAFSCENAHSRMAMNEYRLKS